MPATSKLLCAGASDPGKTRRQNEDRIHVDPDRGLFIVADGLGGHAAGERAAETAIQMMVARLERHTGTTEERIREAIAVANNEIHRLAGTNPEWSGMASVVTLAVVEDGEVSVGQVGDSRLYLLEPGAIRKVTRDHSPVGELEDSGQLGEAAAMAHPRRNEVFRDLGSEPRGPHDEDFVETSRFAFPPNAALLICSDGLSDQVPSQRIRAIVEAHPRDPQSAVHDLVKAANDAGGKDNVSVILVESGGYHPQAPAPQRAARRAPPVIWLIVGFLLATLVFALVRPYVAKTSAGWSVGYGSVRTPLVLRVGAGAHPTIAAALASASPGDTVSVDPGIYRESVHMRPGVSLVSAQRLGATIETTDVGVNAEGIARARLAGFRIAGGGATGIRIVNSDLEVTGVEVTGMTESGIEIAAASQAVILASTIARNPGAGILIHGGASPVIAHNSITGNGTAAEPRPGIQVAGTAAPVITGNIVAENGVEQIWVSPLYNAASLFSTNVIAPGVKDRARQIKVVTR